MELMQLEMFIAVVEECSVGGAARRVYRTQPAVSIALKKLKEEIGVPLLDDSRRSNRKLTEAGEILYEYATRIIAMRDEALAVLFGDQRLVEIARISTSQTISPKMQILSRASGRLAQ